MEIKGRQVYCKYSGISRIVKPLGFLRGDFRKVIEGTRV